MAIRVQCECGRQLQARDEYAGRRTRCPDCGRELLIPELETEEYAPPVPEFLPKAMSPEQDFGGVLIKRTAEKTSGMAIASLVLGILSLFMCCLMPVYFCLPGLV